MIYFMGTGLGEGKGELAMFRQGTGTGQNVHRHSLHWLNASVIKLKKEPSTRTSLLDPLLQLGDAATSLQRS